uniref:G-protein coupled receptors family 1 profile domain-containing protein n=1 Tax=Trichuris muris TaxID=70415 RepID=A0A5S6R5X1_TRIMR
MNRTQFAAITGVSWTSESLETFIILIVISVAALIVDGYLLQLIYRKHEQRVDLCIIAGFTVSDSMASIGLVFTSIHRLQIRLMEPFTVSPLDCILHRFYIPVYMIGNTTLSMTMLLLSVERFATFCSASYYRIIFSIRSTKALVLLCFILGILEAVTCYYVAFGIQDRQISPACYRSQYSTPKYYNIFTSTNIALAILTVLLYALSYAVYRLRMSQSQEVVNLSHLRNARESSVLHSLSIVCLVTLFLRFSPLLAYQLARSAPAAISVIRAVDNSYLVAAPLLYLIIHPSLNGSVSRLACCCCCSSKKLVNTVYTG